MSIAPETSHGAGDQPNPPLVTAGTSDRCPACGAHLAVDQRYCVECGTRRGAPRFRLASDTAAAVMAPVPQQRGVRTGVRRFTQPSSGSVLLVGLLILLLALGVGVLIGHNGNAKAIKQPPISVVVNGAGSGNAAAATPAASTPSSGARSSSEHSAKKKTSTKRSAAKKPAASVAATNPNAHAAGKAGTAAAAKSFSKSATQKSTVGGQCAAGTAGCKNGKQSGNLF